MHGRKLHANEHGMEWKRRKKRAAEKKKRRNIFHFNFVSLSFVPLNASVSFVVCVCLSFERHNFHYYYFLVEADQQHEECLVLRWRLRRRKVGTKRYKINKRNKKEKKRVANLYRRWQRQRTNERKTTKKIWLKICKNCANIWRWYARSVEILAFESNVGKSPTSKRETEKNIIQNVAETNTNEIV